MGIEPQAKLPEGGATSRLRDVRGYSSSEKNWRPAPLSIREKWVEFLEHNKSDVLAIYEMILHMWNVEGS